MLQSASPWSEYTAVLPPGEYTIHDYECHEFAALVTLNTDQSSLFQQMFVLFELLDRLWDGNFKRYSVTQVSAATAAAAAMCSR